MDTGREDELGGINPATCTLRNSLQRSNSQHTNVREESLSSARPGHAFLMAIHTQRNANIENKFRKAMNLC